jgi:hypothetical protein
MIIFAFFSFTSKCTSSESQKNALQNLCKSAKCDFLHFQIWPNFTSTKYSAERAERSFHLFPVFPFLSHLIIHHQNTEQLLSTKQTAQATAVN